MFILEATQKKEARGVVSRLLLGHFASREEFGDPSEYEKIILKRETEHEGVDQIHVAQDGVRCWVTVNTVMKTQISWMARTFLIN
jgi:hypothetical protein